MSEPFDNLEEQERLMEEMLDSDLRAPLRAGIEHYVRHLAGLDYPHLEKAFWDDVRNEFHKATVKHFGEQEIAKYKGK
ncbi:hypothetical protein [Thalassospira australica]|uniref:hypothetical protein n=1 Tax=Thalassospira australica TaxID=1528106 RepID=UPI00384B2AEC